MKRALAVSDDFPPCSAPGAASRTQKLAHYLPEFGWDVSVMWAMREADMLVVYQTPSRNGVTPVAGRTFEYLRTGCPTLAVVPPGDNAHRVRRSAAVHALVTTEDPACVAAAIQDLLTRAGRAVSTVPDPEFLERYSRRRIAERVAVIFEAALVGLPQPSGIRATTRAARSGSSE